LGQLRPCLMRCVFVFRICILNLNFQAFIVPEISTFNEQTDMARSTRLFKKNQDYIHGPRVPLNDNKLLRRRCILINIRQNFNELTKMCGSCVTHEISAPTASQFYSSLSLSSLTLSCGVIKTNAWFRFLHSALLTGCSSRTPS